MTALEQKILDVIQDAFPLDERPYRVLAEMLKSQGVADFVSEQSVFETVEKMRNSGVIRRIGGVYDSKKLGFVSRLCAGKVPAVSTGASDDSFVDAFVAAVNEIPAITHNYIRSHEYNVWFTVIAENEDFVQNIVDELCSKTILHDVHILSVTKKFKINTVMRDADAPVASFASHVIVRNVMKKQSIATLSSFDRTRIRIACTDIPHTLTPFTDWEVSIEELRNDIANGYMRRFGAILRHQQAGFAYNAMVCFNIDEREKTRNERKNVVARSETTKQSILAGSILSKNPHVSHCYERPAFEGFPYNLYAMMHAQSAEDLDRYIKEAAQSIGNPDYAVLHSLKELKKTSYRFFA